MLGGVCILHHFLAVGSSHLHLQSSEKRSFGVRHPCYWIALTEFVMLGCVQQRCRGETPCLSSPWSGFGDHCGDSSMLTLQLSGASSASAQIITRASILVMPHVTLAHFFCWISLAFRGESLHGIQSFHSCWVPFPSVLPRITLSVFIRDSALW